MYKNVSYVLHNQSQGMKRFYMVLIRAVNWDSRVHGLAGPVMLLSEVKGQHKGVQGSKCLLSNGIGHASPREPTSHER